MNKNPRTFSGTFRELWIMAEGKRAEEWAFWAEHLALTANCHRDPKKRGPITPDMINPYAKRSRKRPIGDLISMLRGKFDRFSNGKR